MEEITYDPNTVNNYLEDGNTILTRAIIDDQVDMISDLIANDVDLELREKNFGMTPFLLATHINHIEIMDVLYKNNVNIMATVYVNYADEYFYFEDPASIHNVDKWNALKIAVNNESVDALEYLLDKDEFSIDAPVSDSNDENILIFATWKKKLNTVKYLLEKGASIKKRTESGDTVLHIAIASSSIDVAKELLDENNKEYFDISDIIEKKNLINVTPMMIAAEKGFNDIVQLLIKNGASLNCRNMSGRTPLMVAAFNGHLDVVKTLVSSGSEIDSRDFLDNTALLCAADMVFGKGNKEVVEFLINNGANPNAKNRQDHTALMWAAKKGYPDTTHLLLDKGADVTVKTPQGWTALKYAREWDNVEVIEVIEAFYNSEPEIQVRARLNEKDNWDHLLNDSVFYFGEVSLESNRRAEFLICNYGSNDLILSNINIEDKQVVEVDATESSSIIRPGKETIFYVTFDVDSRKQGEYSTKITISSNDPNESKFNIRIRGIWK